MITKNQIKKAFLAYENKVNSFFEDFHVSLLGQGENNRNYLVELGDKKFIFRLPLKEHIEKNMVREARMLGFVPKSVGSQLLVFDNSKKVIPFVFMILTFLPGEKVMHWNKNQMSLVAKTLAELHSLTKSDKAGIWRRKKSLSFYDSHIRWLEKDHKKEVSSSEIKLLWKQVKKFLLSHHDLITSRRDFALIQNDVTPDNVLFHKNKAFIIDWEWAKFGDYASDLTNFFSFSGDFFPWRFGCSLNEIKFFVSEYKHFRGKGFHDPTLLKRVLLMNELNQFCDMVYALWKVNNYNKEKGTLSKSKYQSIYKKDLAYFKLKYGVD